MKRRMQLIQLKQDDPRKKISDSVNSMNEINVVFGHVATLLGYTGSGRTRLMSKNLV